MDSQYIALIGSVFGGVGLEVTRRILNRSHSKQDWAAELRKEMREDNAVLRVENDALEKEVVIWKDKYYALIDKYLELKHRQIEADIDERLLNKTREDLGLHGNNDNNGTL